MKNRLKVSLLCVKIKNESIDLSADLSVATTNNNTVFFTLSSEIDKTSLVAGEATTVTVTVEVTKTQEGYPYMEVNAVNSYGVEVYIVYDGTPISTAVENTHGQSPMNKCQKQLRNGQLLIQRDGMIYNVLGVQMK